MKTTFRPHTARTRHSIMLCVLLFIFSSLNAQVEVSHKGEQVTIMSGTTVFVNGSLNVLSGNADRIANDGAIFISDSIVNNGTRHVFGTAPTNGYVVFNNSNTSIGGTDTVHFYDVDFQLGGDTLTLNNNIFVNQALFLSNGKIFLNGRNINLGENGNVSTVETSISHIYGFPGSISMRRIMTNGNTYTNLGGLGLNLTASGNLGSFVDIEKFNAPLSGPANGSINRYFTFSPDNDALVSFPEMYYIDPTDLNAQDENELKVYLSEDAGATWTGLDGSVDPFIDVVSSLPSSQWTLTSNTLLTLAEDTCDTPPYVDILEDTLAICSGADAIVYADGADGLASTWSNGTLNNDTALVSTTGYTYVTVEDNNGCTNTDSVMIVVDDFPVAGFTALPICDGALTTFNNTSTHASPGTLSYEWNFNDAGNAPNDTSSLASPTFTFSGANGYGIELIVSTPYSCRDTFSNSYTVLPFPVANFTVNSSNCADSLFAPTNSSSVTPVAGITYEWDFGDGFTSSAFEPTHSYGTDGTYNIELIATSNGCEDTMVQVVTSNPVPVPDFTVPALICDNATTTFTNTSTISSGSMVYSWDYPSGTTGSIDLTTTISTIGGNNITLTATSDLGCPANIQQVVTVNESPTINVFIDDPCQDADLDITNNSTGSGTLSHLWDFDGLATSTDADPVYAFTNDGPVVVNYTISSDNGCSATQNFYPFVSPLPVADFSWSDDCDGIAIEFTNNSSVPGGQGSLSYDWDFDNGNSSFITDPTELFASDGNYDVQLIALDVTSGCSDTVVNTVTVFPLPSVDLGDTIATCGTSYVLDALNPGSTYLWNDASTNQTLTANSDGIYYVDVTDGNGCFNSDTVDITLNTALVVNLGADITVCNDRTLDADYPGATFLWNTTETSQTITITTSGDYDVMVQDQNACVGYDTVQVTVNTSTPFSLGPDLSSCDGETETLDIGLTTGSYLWSDNSTTQTIDVTTTGSYWASFTNLDNCVSFDTVDVVFNLLPIVNLGADYTACDGTVLQSNILGMQYLWSTSAIDSAITVTNSGDYWLEVTDMNTSCFNSDTINITINASPLVDLGNDIVLCDGGDATLDAQHAGATYLWNTTETTQTISVNTSGTYYVTVTDANACEGSDTVEVNSGGQMLVDLGPDMIICSNSSAFLTPGYPNADYNWYNSTGIISTDSIYAISSADTIWVEVTNVYGCSESDTIVITQATEDLVASYWAQSTVLPGDSIKFVNLSYPKPYTSTWDFADGLISNDSCPVHAYFVPGEYDVLLTVDNGSCTDSKLKTITVLPIKGEGIIAEPIPVEQVDTLYNEILDVNLYPNPNNGAFTVTIDLYSQSEVELMLFNLYGQLIHRESLEGENINQQYSFESLTPGVYFLNIYLNRNNIKTARFIVQ